MLLAELEVWHSRPFAPTRRLALGHMMLPVEPSPGFGGLLLGCIVASHLRDVDDDLVPDIHRLITQVERGERVVQPRLRHRFQVDRHGLSRSTHRLVGDGEQVHVELTTNGSPLQQVLGSIYAVERLGPDARHALSSVLHRALRWHGPDGPSLIAHLAGSAAASLSTLADPRAWALEVLGFPVGTSSPGRKEVMARFRTRLREVHPDHGGETDGASRAIVELGEARRILLDG